MAQGFASISRFNLTQVGSVAITLGQKTMANSVPVVIASDQSVLNVDATGSAVSASIADGGGSITVDNPIISVIGGGTEAAAMRVTIANNSTGVLSVDDNGSSLTVDGTVAATQSGTWNITNVSGTVSLPTGAATAANQSTVITAVQIMDDWDNAASDGASVSGDVAHDSADAGEPVKTGGKAFDFATSSTGAKGQTAVVANDRVNSAMTLQGELPIFRKAKYEEPTNIDTAYDTSTTETQTSDAINVDGYNHHVFGFDLAKANTPTDILIEIEVDLGDGNFKKLMNWGLGSWYYDDVAVGTGGLKEAYYFTCSAKQIRIKVSGTGLSGSNTFTMSNSVLRSWV